MNSFFIPQLGSQVYTMAGMTSQVSLQADDAGDYHGLSSHFSGEGFADMHFIVRAAPPEAYAKWLVEQRQTGPALDKPAYTELAKPSKNIPPTGYKNVAPGLFEAIIKDSASAPGAKGSAAASAAPNCSAGPARPPTFAKGF
jgi:cytochrome o ubiquinol oxidase subunit 2